MIKLVIIGILVLVIANLAMALPTLLRQNDQSKLTQFLGRRLLGSSIILLLLFIAIALGWIQPNPAPWHTNSTTPPATRTNS
ncbi:DUF2909 family protein [Motilimonas eburnea]|uniref:DUF2909 family protein n=1 Tax=Motilimonas eburnea TaxID=1737488 RepID=UPI001E510261|nr:DUF2909 family protein [Motilimonas eburnea]MCE2572347.1 DUF2909 domain-containing protein [Motilimonas eburnea]